MAHVIIGVDPHKLFVTIEVVDDREQFLGSGRFSTDQTGPTTGASAPRARSPSRRSYASSAGSPTPSTANCSPTNNAASVQPRTRVREGTAGRHINPARSTCPRTSALRISHFLDPQCRRYPPTRPLRTPTRGRLPSRRGDKRRRTLQRADPGPLTTEGSRLDAPLGARRGCRCRVNTGP